ncbi:GntR family transcriptional regulator [Paenibacillus eucommiae]|uniref:GntR family transcriptional regulator of arabinose operon n=1 Tax=Paenibacillus eucommiae TaxID=1355755 RepID=A0ABS4J5D9_9BACL|nr:GntR family transcriptional regulator [Paenibacillus eucommiae]MBP1995045.1 GntR family transcriptional regulator of arabinose operon [Paenibacillus eucommiae]
MKEKQIPKYMQLKQEIFSWLQAGRLKSGDQMLSENELAVLFQMSRQTVRQTFSELEREGWLYRVQGKGTFVTNPLARGLHKVPTIGVITPCISDYLFPLILRGAEAAARARGYRLLISSTDNEKDKEREILQMLLNEPLSGLIIEPTRSAWGNPNLSYFLSLEQQNMPYMMINECYMELNCPCLKVDDELGGFLAAEHLLRMGHRRIAGFFKMDDLQGVNRLKGFIRAHREYQVMIEPDAVIHYTTEEMDTKPFEQAVWMLSRELGAPTGFVCQDDALAVKLLEAARRTGKNVPEDLSVVGFDDSSLATAAEVKLTTLTHPKTDLGRQAAELLMDRIEGKSSDSQADSLIHKPQLIIRESTWSLVENNSR